eukprot:scaffold25294_cov21-Tisochrysis_lutea.AAC.1
MIHSLLLLHPASFSSLLSPKLEKLGRTPRASLFLFLFVSIGFWAPTIVERTIGPWNAPRSPPPLPSTPPRLPTKSHDGRHTTRATSSASSSQQAAETTPIQVHSSRGACRA